MSKIIITDLFYNTKNINNNTPFLLIHSDEIKHLLIKLDFNDNSIIYGYNIPYIRKILNNFDIDLNNFKFLFHIRCTNKLSQVSHSALPKYIIICNNSITKPINNFTFIDNFNNGTIWSPVPTNEYSPLGLFYSKTKNMPNINASSNCTDNIGIIDRHFLIKSDNSSYNILSEDTCYLTHPNQEKYTILNKKFINDSDEFKTLRNTKHFSYNPQGELISSNTYSSFVDEYSNNLKNNLKSFNDEWSANFDIKKKWFPYEENPDALDSSTISSRSTCETNNEYNNIYTGNKVVLVNSENPWYKNINDLDNINQNINVNVNINKNINNLDNNFDKNIIKQKYNETFDPILENSSDNKKTINLIISILIIIFIVYMIYTFY